MTSTNNPRLPPARRDIARLITRPGAPARTAEEAIERSMALWRLISTQENGDGEEILRTKVSTGVHRSLYPQGPRRQTAAIVESGDLRRWTRRIMAPTLVIHGDADPLVRIAGGRDLAATIPGAEMLVMEGMAHDLPAHYLPQMTDALIAHIRRAEAA